MQLSHSCVVGCMESLAGEVGLLVEIGWKACFSLGDCVTLMFVSGAGVWRRFLCV